MKTKTYTIAQDSIEDVLSTLIDSKSLGTEKNWNVSWNTKSVGMMKCTI